MAIQGSWCGKRLVLIVLFPVLILTFCTSCADGAGGVVSPTKGTFDPESIVDLYGAKCGICHGADGKMQNAGAKDLTTSILEKNQVLDLIRFGKGTMPPQKDILSPEQIEALAVYSMSLRGK